MRVFLSLCIVAAFLPRVIFPQVNLPQNRVILRFDSTEIYYYGLFPEWKQSHAVMFYSTADKDSALCVAYNADGDVTRKEIYSINILRLLKEYTKEYTRMRFRCRTWMVRKSMKEQYASIYRLQLADIPDEFESAPVILYYMNNDHTIDTLSGICMYVDNNGIVLHPDIANYYQSMLETYSWDRILHVEYEKQTPLLMRTALPAAILSGFMYFIIKDSDAFEGERSDVIPPSVYFATGVFVWSALVFAVLTSFWETSVYDIEEDKIRDEREDVIQELAEHQFFQHGLPPNNEQK